jgi:hypothetical protein
MNASETFPGCTDLHTRMIQFVNSSANRNVRPNEMKKERPFKMQEDETPRRRSRTPCDRATIRTEYMTQLYFLIQADEPWDFSTWYEQYKIDKQTFYFVKYKLVMRACVVQSAQWVIHQSGQPEDVGFDSRWKQCISLHQRVQTGSGARSASYPVGIGFFSQRIKGPGSKTDHLRLVSKLRMHAVISLLPVYHLGVVLEKSFKWKYF